MRQVTRYSEAIKASVLAKAMALNAPGVVELANEFNIPIGTIYTWKSNMLKKQNLKQINAQRPKDKSAAAKLQAVIDTAEMPEHELGAYCREHGIYTHHLKEWKQRFLESFDAVGDKVNKTEHKQAVHENKKLKQELHRKDKALAEVSALLVLKKKADLIWGIIDEDD